MSSWRRVTFHLPPDIEEEVLVRLHELGSLGAESTDGAMTAWFEEPLDAGTLLASLREALGPAGAALRIAATAEEPDGFWHERWMASLQPFAVGASFLVVPGPATPADAGGRRILRLTPGRAFGTGEHPTTRMCVVLLESCLSAGESLLDLGTGSGILALAARALGADPVLALDVDPVAAQVAARNARINDAHGILVAAGGHRVVRPGRRFDWVAANITGATLVRLMSEVSAIASRGMILSGILAEEEGEVVRRAASCGLRLRSRLSEGDWVALSMLAPDR